MEVTYIGDYDASVSQEIESNEELKAKVVKMITMMKTMKKSSTVIYPLKGNINMKGSECVIHWSPSA